MEALILLAILFRRTFRNLFLVVTVLIGLTTWWTIDFWAGRYNAWDTCGRPTTEACRR